MKMSSSMIQELNPIWPFAPLWHLLSPLLHSTHQPPRCSSILPNALLPQGLGTC